MKSRGKKTYELRTEYDLAPLLKSGARGKYATQYQSGANSVLIEPEIRSQFKTAKEVNDALRLVIELKKIGQRRTLAR